jgi:hypothetical protein
MNINYESILFDLRREVLVGGLANNVFPIVFRPRDKVYD